MKYHATITNANGTRVSKGCNDRLTIVISKGNTIAATIVIDDRGVRQDIFPELNETCAYCGEKMYTTVRAHHHTENGVDVTKA